MGHQGLISKKLLVCLFIKSANHLHRAYMSTLILKYFHISSTSSSRSNIESPISTILGISFSWSSFKDTQCHFQLNKWKNKINQKPGFEISVSKMQTPLRWHNFLHLFFSTRNSSVSLLCLLLTPSWSF